MSQTKFRAYICCGPNCGPKDSHSLLDYLAREVERRGLAEQVSALPTGCQSHCLSGPTMVVYPGPIYYQEITAARLDRIIEEHFITGKPVEAYFWTGPRIKLIPRSKSAPTSVQLRGDTPGGEEPIESPQRKREKKAPDVDDFKW